MSKLSKFKSVLPMKSAATLLSGLISEEVDVHNLMSLYEGGWIRLFRPCHGAIMKLKPMFEQELHEQHVRDGRYFMESDHHAGVCLGFHLPCDSVDIRGRRAYVLRDADGGLYGVMDSQTDMFLSAYDDDDPENPNVLVLTSDIYTIAEQANTNSMPERPEVLVIENDQCIWSEQTLYNFVPNELPNSPRPAPINTQEVFPPSLRITVSALLEAATSERKNHTQASLIESILERNKGIRGLSESSLQKHFSDSNAELARLRKVVQD